MKLADAMKRIEELERKVKELEAKPSIVYHYYYQQPLLPPPTNPLWPSYPTVTYSTVGATGVTY